MQERTRRIWMAISGVLICGFSVGRFIFSALGLDLLQFFCLFQSDGGKAAAVWEE